MSDDLLPVADCGEDTCAQDPLCDHHGDGYCDEDAGPEDGDYDEDDERTEDARLMADAFLGLP